MQPDFASSHRCQVTYIMAIWCWPQSFGAFLGPRGPLRTPLVPVSVVRCCPQQKFQTLSSRNLSFLFLQTLSSSNLSHSTQNIEQDQFADLSSPIWSCFVSSPVIIFLSRSIFIWYLLNFLLLSLSQGIDSDDDDDEAKEEEGGDQNCEEEEYQLELAHGYVKKGEKPKWEKRFYWSRYIIFYSLGDDALAWSWREVICSWWTPTCLTSPVSHGTAPNTRSMDAQRPSSQGEAVDLTTMS